jgi:ribosomal protein RSM22 (predicted rRNA methylase)
MSSVKKMINASNRYVLMIDTGTPRTYENFMKVKRMVPEYGWKVIAPCMTEKCGLKNDYCQFYARVERSSLQKMAKEASLSYEDEKYFYLLLAKDDVKLKQSRVIRRPIIKTNVTELKVCDSSGVREVLVTKKNKEIYKKSKKTKINELIDLTEL